MAAKIGTVDGEEVKAVEEVKIRYDHPDQSGLWSTPGNAPKPAVPVSESELSIMQLAHVRMSAGVVKLNAQVRPWST